ncbi:hypothetical protein Misp04_34610 [Micromonospora sp. NBRC 101691]|nr:hypothetical protein Misp04_34610 [Micromonospora sp. NBRC 101691]
MERPGRRSQPSADAQTERYKHQGHEQQLLPLLVSDVADRCPLPPTTETEGSFRAAAGWKVLASSGPDGLVGVENGLPLYVLPTSDVDSRPAPTLEIVRDEPVWCSRQRPEIAIVGRLSY